MIRALGRWLESFFRAAMPDPFVIAIFLTLLTGAIAYTITDAGVLGIVAAWQGPRGFFGLLGFGMQMCLVLVTGHALAKAPVVRRLLKGLSSRPRSAKEAVACVGFVAVLTSFLNWGLALIVGALLAKEVGLECKRRGIRVHYPLLAAAGYAGLMTWHGGFSGSAPLKVTTSGDLVELLGASTAAQVEPLSLYRTVLGSMNVWVSLGLLVLVPWVLASLCPGPEEPIVEAPDPQEAHGQPRLARMPSGPRGWPEAMESSAIVVWLLVAPLAVALFVYYHEHGLARLDPNAVNLTLLTVGLALHGSVRSYLSAVKAAVLGCTGIIIQFPLYGGIMGIMSGTGLSALMAGWVGAQGSATGYLVLTFLLAGLLNLFVPSGGGQWAIQGPIAVEAALRLGVPMESAVMAVAYGDQWSNMLQPFWALPLLGVTGLRAQDMMGYTAVVMLTGGAWFVLGLLLWG